MISTIGSAFCMTALAICLSVVLGCGEVFVYSTLDAGTETMATMDSGVDGSTTETAPWRKGVKDGATESYESSDSTTTVSCVAGCIPTCGVSSTSDGCRACTAVDAGYPSQSCDPQGFSVCCRYAPSGLPYCQSTEVCQ